MINHKKIKEYQIKKHKERMNELIDDLDYMYNRLYIMSGECLEIQKEENKND